MKKHQSLFVLLAILFGFLFFGNQAIAQTAVNQEVIDLTWSLEGLDLDTQSFRVYMSDQPDFLTATQLGEDLPYNPNDPAAAETFEWPSMSIDIPGGEMSTRYFWVTSVDTSGNECGPGNDHQVCLDVPPSMVAVEFDRVPPVPPSGLTVTARVVVNTTQ
jgi:hypothetical protein